jgi:hypothetical protein
MNDTVPIVEYRLSKAVKAIMNCEYGWIISKCIHKFYCEM